MTYTVSEPTSQLHRETSSVLVVLPASKVSERLGAMSITLPEGVRARKYVIHASATMLGVTQTRNRVLTVYQ